MLAVTFDVGNTLLFPSPNVPTVFRQSAAQYGYDFDLTYLEGLYPALDEYYERRYLENADFWCSAEGSRQLWIDLYLLYGDLAGVTKFRNEIAEATNAVYETGEGWAAFADVVPCLRRLKKEGIAVGLISNWGASLTQILDDLGIAPYCDAVITSSQTHYRKPQREIFEIAFDALGAKAHNVVHVGDLPEADGAGAAAADAHPLIIDRRRNLSGDPYSHITTLDELTPAKVAAYCAKR